MRATVNTNTSSDNPFPKIPENTPGIYKITSPSGRVYIGQSINIPSRWVAYRYYYKKDRSLILYHSFEKYGYKKHKFEVLEFCDASELNNRERYWIEYFKSNFRKYPQNRGLNLQDGGNVPPIFEGVPKSEETRKKIAEKLRKSHFEGKYLEKRAIRLGYPFCVIPENKNSFLGNVSEGINDLALVTPHKSLQLGLSRREILSKIKGEKKVVTQAIIDGNLRKGLKTRKVVYQYSLDGTLLNTFNGLVEVKSELGLNPSAISRCCKGLQRQAFGFIWKYKQKV
ncbi:group I intron endonuclease [Spirosoma oryzae]|uniref:Group I intron endonuclease n=1 Tax=Spirosoma oryzae TaxID=1469603 RepID=A0A2T0SYL3_9BACT|nr:GIY-YIG nuclease family protein [Spirosoma oryzae]PRY38521.1 group I intron endonuclease [Spirosoma oryzae]